MKTIVAVALCAFCVPALAQQPAPIERVKLADNELTCRQMHTEIGEMDGIVKASAEAAGSSRNVATGAAVATQAAPAANALGGLGGLFGQLAAQVGGTVVQSKAQDNAAQADARQKQATARKEHLTGMFVAKGCNASNPDAAPDPAKAQPLQVAAAAAADPAKLLERAGRLQPLDSLQSVQLESTLDRVSGKAPKVAIAGFRVAFVTSRKANAYAGAGLANIGATNRVRQAQNKSIEIKLQGVDASWMQAIADAAYADFVARLKARGHEIVELETVKSAEAFKALQLVPLEGKPYVKDERIVVSPSAIPLWLAHFEPLGGLSFGLGNWQTMSKLSADLNAVVLIPTLSIDFAAVSSSGRSNYGSHAEVDAKAAMAIEGGQTILWAMHAENPRAGDFQSARLKASLAVPGEYGETKTADTYNDAGLANLGTMLTGMQGTQRSQTKLVVQAEPGRYADRALAGVATLNEALVGALGKK